VRTQLWTDEERCQPEPRAKDLYFANAWAQDDSIDSPAPDILSSGQAADVSVSNMPAAPGMITEVPGEIVPVMRIVPGFC
jgi:hypothetical protein